MNHNEIAGPAVSPIKFVGVASVEGKVKIALRIHLTGCHEVESLGDLPVTLAQFRPGTA